MTTIGAGTGLLALGLGVVLPLGAAGPARATNSSCPTPRVAGVSYAVDVFSTGSRVGPGIFYGLVSSVAGSQPLPGPLGEAQQTALAAGAKAVADFSAASPQYFAQFNAAIAPMAAFNPGIDAVLTAAAGSMTAAANPAISPFDRTALQVANMVQTSEEPAPACH